MGPLALGRRPLRDGIPGQVLILPVRACADSDTGLILCRDEFDAREKADTLSASLLRYETHVRDQKKNGLIA